MLRGGLCRGLVGLTMLLAAPAWSQQEPQQHKATEPPPVTGSAATNGAPVAGEASAGAAAATPTPQSHGLAVGAGSASRRRA